MPAPIRRLPPRSSCPAEPQELLNHGTAVVDMVRVTFLPSSHRRRGGHA
ncbi:hypothetical protein ACFPM0_15085 [Pseudonocardia sulfidoxydans]